MHLWEPKPLLRIVAPCAPRLLPMLEKEPNMTPKSSPSVKKELQKSSLFGAWPGGLREALTINESIISLMVKGSELMAQGSCLKARGSRLVAHDSREMFLGHGP